MPGSEVCVPNPNAEDPSLGVGSRLCIQCGLCCTGALHNYAVLDPEEISLARSLGLTLRTEGRPGFSLPCPRLDGCKCSIYENRPKVCGRYKCQLLENVEAGLTDFDSAIAKVRAAKELVEEVTAVMPAGMTLPEAREMVRREPSADGDCPEPKDMPLKLAITALSFYLDRHFRNSREGKILSVVPIAEEQVGTEMK